MRFKRKNFRRKSFKKFRRSSYKRIRKVTKRVIRSMAEKKHLILISTNNLFAGATYSA